MCRCKACDKPLDEHEIKWDEARVRWEDLCAVCVEIAYASMLAGGYLSDERSAKLSRRAAHNYAAALTRLGKDNVK